VRPHQARVFSHSRNGFRFNAQDFLVQFAQGVEKLSPMPSLPAFCKWVEPGPKPALALRLGRHPSKSIISPS